MNRRAFLGSAAAVAIPTSAIAIVPKKLSLEEFLAGENPEQRAFWHLKEAAKAMKEYSGGEWSFGLNLEYQAGFLVRK
jgi:hypothetical protein